MTTIGQSLGMTVDARKWRKTVKVADNSTFVGLEIELEGLGNFGPGWVQKIRENGLWNVVKDGSLRDNGMEFIMSTENGEPVKAGDIIRALNLFQKVMTQYTESGYPAPKCSIRTSIHVHIDVRDLTIPQLKKYMLLYAAFEDIFFAWSDPTRRDNNYCRSLDLHPDIIDRVGYVVGTEDNPHFNVALSEGNKYDAMNFLSVRQRGSMEFRLMHGTYDTKLMLEWINILLALKLAAQDEEIVIDSFPEDMSRRGIPNLIDQVFGAWGKGLKPYATDMDILMGVRKAQDILLTFPVRELDEQFNGHSDKNNSHLNAFKAALEV